MVVKEIIELLSTFEPDTNAKILINGKEVHFTKENLLLTSTERYIDDSFPQDEWDCEDGKLIQKGEDYILFNPPIF